MPIVLSANKSTPIGPAPVVNGPFAVRIGVAAPSVVVVRRRSKSCTCLLAPETAQHRLEAPLTHSRSTRPGGHGERTVLLFRSIDCARSDGISGFRSWAGSALVEDSDNCCPVWMFNGRRFSLSNS